MPALNLALGLRVIGGAADVFHFLLITYRMGCRIEHLPDNLVHSNRVLLL